MLAHADLKHAIARWQRQANRSAADRCPGARMPTRSPASNRGRRGARRRRQKTRSEAAGSGKAQDGGGRLHLRAVVDALDQLQRIGLRTRGDMGECQRRADRGTQVRCPIGRSPEPIAGRPSRAASSEGQPLAPRASGHILGEPAKLREASVAEAEDRDGQRAFRSRQAAQETAWPKPAPPHRHRSRSGSASAWRVRRLGPGCSSARRGRGGPPPSAPRAA